MSENSELEDPVDYSTGQNVLTDDIISTSAKLAEICKCGPNKCKSNGRCCDGCPGMEGNYCQSDESSLDSNTGSAYTISRPGASSVVDIADFVSLADASCQTDDAENVLQATQCGCSCVAVSSKSTLSVYKEYQHLKGGCCIHS